ncbi:hypothetical protein FACS1894154_08560 [Betaproteobacteria bacterium]|nr:hypothetical protein FACS1894154_08560 [Betaproteobacteria bacterium]GHU29010.1 hypothetical protein FACS189497_05940 [Betaproteobacteria bacterium]
MSAGYKDRLATSATGDADGIGAVVGQTVRIWRFSFCHLDKLLDLNQSSMADRQPDYTLCVTLYMDWVCLY